MFGRLSTVKRIEYSPYTLQPKQAKTRREGALLRVEFEDCVGYADCHPWTEIGDEPLQLQLQRLSLRMPTALCWQALEWAHLDAKARKLKKKLLSITEADSEKDDGLLSYHYTAIPKSHFLILQLDESAPDFFEKGLSLGFDRFKLKLNRETSQKLSALEILFRKCEKADVKLRLDLNEHLKRSELEDFLAKISFFKPWVEYIEDPFSFDLSAWEAVSEKFGFKFACDVKIHHKFSDLNKVPIAVVKPAICSFDRIRELQNPQVVFTSYAAHPLEQMVSAYAAAHTAKQDPKRVIQSGLLSHRVYKKNAFSECLKNQGPLFFPSDGYGFGFDDLLLQQKWIKLWAHSK